MSDELKPGYVWLDWRNKKLGGDEDFDHKWHHYMQMSEGDAKDFLETKAKNSGFFDFRIHRPTSPRVASSGISGTNPSAL